MPPRTTRAACVCGAAVGAGADAVERAARAGRGRRRRAGGRHRARPLRGASSTWCAKVVRASSRCRGHGRQRRHRRRRRGADRRRRRRVKVGVGPGSICTTRVVAGVGVPQITAIARLRASPPTRHGVPLIADGGIQYSGDIAKALAAGADAVMLGTPAGRRRREPGRGRALPGRALQGVPRHGLDRRHEGPLVLQGPLLPGRRRSTPRSSCPRASRAGWPTRARCAESCLPARRRPAPGHGLLRRRHHRRAARTAAAFVRITGAGLRESHPHDITITNEAPNYWGR